jgi:hypothetical protein
MKVGCLHTYVGKHYDYFIDVFDEKSVLNPEDNSWVKTYIGKELITRMCPVVVLSELFSVGGCRYIRVLTAEGVMGVMDYDWFEAVDSPCFVEI